MNAFLINTCASIECLDEGTSVADLCSEFDDPTFDKSRDLGLWEDSAGRLIGFGQLWISESGDSDGFLWYRIRPNLTDGEVERQIFAWGEMRMGEVARERNVSVKLRTNARESQTQQINFIESQGFTVERYFWTKARSLSLPIPEPQFPEGFTQRQVKVEDLEAWVEMFNQTFIDHWNHHDINVERLQHWWNEPTYNPELDLVAIAPDGTFAAFCFCNIFFEENKRNERKDGWIGALGTRRGFRKLGLGRAMLLSGMQRLKALGMDTAKLGVDADNPSGATKLYESVGFQTLYTKIVYVKDLG